MSSSVATSDARTVRIMERLLIDGARILAEMVLNLFRVTITFPDYGNTVGLGETLADAFNTAYESLVDRR